MARGSAKGCYWQPKHERDSRRVGRYIAREVEVEREETVLSLDLDRVLDDFEHEADAYEAWAD